jgi:hypothetical protein
LGIGYRGGRVSLLPRALGWLVLCAGCAAPSRRERPPEWIELGAGVFDLGRDAEPVDDAFGLFLGGGYDLLRRPPLRFGPELGLAWARHDLLGIDPVEEDDEPRLNVVRGSAGLRAELALGALPFSVSVRGGWGWRDEDSHAAEFAGNDQSGTYVGAALDYWYRPWASLEPFVFAFRGADDDLEETFVGIAARFHLTPDPLGSQRLVPHAQRAW